MKKTQDRIRSLIRRSNPKMGHKAGMAPGTVTYVGEQRNFVPWIDVIDFDAHELKEYHRLDVDDLLKLPPSPAMRWVQITGVHDATLINRIGDHYQIHQLVLEDIVHTSQRPKLDEYPDYLYLVLKMIGLDAQTGSEVKSEQLSILYRSNLLVTFIEDEGDLMEPVRDRLRKGNQKLRGSGTDYLLYSILDNLVDQYFVVLERIGDRLEDLEMRLLDNPREEDLRELHRAKRELIYLRKFIWPLREVVGMLAKDPEALFHPGTSMYLRDVYDHCIRVIDTLETYRDLSSGLMDIYLSSISNRMNMVMKTLTIIATIFIPLTFIVGVYGMNFDIMPELHMAWAYPAVWALMIGIAGGMLIWFRRKNWW